MKKRLNLKLLFVFISLFCFAGIYAQKNTFEIKNGDFVYNNKPTRIISGEMHYPRIPHQYWRHRFKMLRAMGLNTVATYVFWNIHEPEPEKWDFEGDKNLREYIKIAGEEGLHVILRPGPYVCAEWEFGGYPWWLQNIEGLVLRSNNEQFLERTQIYLKRLFEEVGDLQITKGGPIIMVQVENEFGSYVAQRKDVPMAEHKAYNAKIKEQLHNVGFEVPLFTSDGTWIFEEGSIKGVLPTANGEGNIENLKKVINKYHDGKGPYMVAEFYPGWLAHWMEPHPKVDPSLIARKAEEYLKNDVSFNVYMVHGGTNFGFTSGANYNNEHDIQPDLTSYDYDAPISEAGWVTPKFDSLRSVISKYVDWKVTEIPEKIKVIEMPTISLTKAVDVMKLLKKGKSTSNDKPLTFEELNQGSGYVLYTYHFNQPTSGTLDISGLRDFATVYLNGSKIGELNRYYNEYTMSVDIPFNSTLEILVENMGRINYGEEIVNNKKGIISPVKINDVELTGGWVMYQLPMDKMPDFTKLSTRDVVQNDSKSTNRLLKKPLFYEGKFTLNEVGDTFLDLSNYGKGIVFVNGKNIGRYWNVGPQQTLFVPGVWLNKGDNTIVVFEQIGDEIFTELKSTKNPILHDLR